MTADSGNGNGAVGLRGRVALVTGAARGIGRAVSLALACRGVAVAVNYRACRAEAEQLAEEILNLGAECLLVQGDVSVETEACAVVQRVLEEWNRLDILVNNTGITRDRTLGKTEDDAWSHVISVNSRGTYYCTSAAAPMMIDQKFGRIINIAFCAGQTGNSGQANVAASKGVIAFTKTVALELAKYNITANAIAPGFTRTEMLDQVPANILDQIKAKIPLGRLAMPDEIAKAVVFLAADGDYITGQQINVNGGVYM